MRTRGTALVAGLAAGLVAGFLWAQSRQERHRADLFSGRPARRRAALGWLAGDRRPQTAQLLRDYVRWEREPRLKARGAVLLRELERDLELGAA